MILSRNPRIVQLCALLLGVACLMPVSARAQVVNPADKQGPKKDDTDNPPVPEHSWELPAIDVIGDRPPRFRDEEKVGAYRQPRWTTRRPWGETRVYVVSEGQFEFEYWLIYQKPRHGEAKVKKQYEAEFGLPGRFQLDLYLVSAKEGKEGTLAVDEEKVELRWALAEWGRLPANPTLYAEWISVNDGPDHVEGKLLLGDQIDHRWRWGANLVFEHEMGGARENSKEITAGASYMALDEKLAVGGEVKYANVDTRADRSDDAHELLAGPSIQFRPLPQAHIDLAPLFGVTDDAPKSKVVALIGWEF